MEIFTIKCPCCQNEFRQPVVRSFSDEIRFNEARNNPRHDTENIGLSTPQTDSDKARNAGMQQVDKHAHEAWKKRCLFVIQQLCQRNVTIDADMISAELSKYPEETHDNRAIGPMLTRAKKLGYCRPTNEFTRTTQKQCHGMPRRIWQSCIFQVPSRVPVYRSASFCECNSSQNGEDMNGNCINCHLPSFSRYSLLGF